MCSSCTPLEKYACCRGYRQFHVSVVQFYGSLKTPSAEGFVGLYCLVSCTTVPEEIAIAFIDFFVYIAKNLDNKHADLNKAVELLTNANRVEYMEMKPNPFTENDLMHTISNMKIRKSSGYDGISNMNLKHCVKAISKPFFYICNFSITYRILPDRWKYELVLPVYKRGKRTNMSNYRPISLLLSLSKVLEACRFNRLNQHININRILVPEQYAFRRGINIENKFSTNKYNTQLIK